jgi:hypothetical protein
MSNFTPSIQTSAQNLGVDVRSVGNTEVPILTQILVGINALTTLLGGSGGSTGLVVTSTQRAYTWRAPVAAISVTDAGDGTQTRPAGTLISITNNGADAVGVSFGAAQTYANSSWNIAAGGNITDNIPTGADKVVQLICNTSATASVVITFADPA